jgi:hypothetical protein
MVAELLVYVDQAYSFKPGRLLTEMKIQAATPMPSPVPSRLRSVNAIERRRAGAATRAIRGKR